MYKCPKCESRELFELRRTDFTIIKGNQEIVHSFLFEGGEMTCCDCSHSGPVNDFIEKYSFTESKDSTI